MGGAGRRRTRQGGLGHGAQLGGGLDDDGLVRRLQGGVPVGPGGPQRHHRRRRVLERLLQQARRTAWLCMCAALRREKHPPEGTKSTPDVAC